MTELGDFSTAPIFVGAGILLLVIIVIVVTLLKKTSGTTGSTRNGPKKCPKCDHENGSHLLFCVSCGYDLKQEFTSTDDMPINKMQRVADKLENGKVKRDERWPDQTQVRGRCDGVPTKCAFSGDTVQVTMKAQNPFIGQGSEDYIFLEWEEGKAEIATDADDDFNDDFSDEDKVRIFVGKNVFIEQSAHIAPTYLLSLNRIPVDVVKMIIDSMQSNQFSMFMLNSQEAQIRFSTPLSTLSIEQIDAGFDLLKGLIKYSGKVELIDDEKLRLLPLKLVVCNYCTANFNISTNSQCPNCGAPFDSSKA